MNQSFDVEGVAIDADSLRVEFAAVSLHEEGVFFGLGDVDLY